MSDIDVTLSDSSFSKLRSIIHKNTGITIGETRKTMILSRLRSRLRETKDVSFSAYISRLGTDPKEMQELINRVTTNKTYFYRTPRIWEHFLEVALPEFRLKATAAPFRVWSAAASRGDEAHTIGMVLEEVRKKDGPFEYEVLGTDVSSEVLATAQAGVYFEGSLKEIRKHRPALVQDHMTGNDADGYRVTPDIKSRITFKLHNLQNKAPGGKVHDVIFLRNVLIYFTPEDQETILENVAEKMADDGTLIIGESETLSQLTTPFELVAPMVYRKRDFLSGTRQ